MASFFPFFLLKSSLIEFVNDAIETVTSLCGADVVNKMIDLIEEIINPWYDANMCKLTRNKSTVKTYIFVRLVEFKECLIM